MSIIEFQAIYIMWLRQMKRFLRSKSRVIARIIQPIIFLAILGSGLRGIAMPGVDYLDFLAPATVAMAIMFSSMFTGLSIILDKESGFMQEVLVAPVSRFSIIFGRTIGGATIAIMQGFFVLFIAILMGVKIPSIFNFILAVIFMIVNAFAAVGLGLILASRIKDYEGFPLVMNLAILPLFFLSTAFFPILDNNSIPEIVQKLVYVNPLFYMVDGLRGSLTQTGNVLHPLIDLSVVLVICIIFMSIGSILFSRSEV